MTDLAIEIEPRISIEDIRELSKHAKAIGRRVRKGILKPTNEKIAPKFSTSQMCEMLEVESHQVDHAIKVGKFAADMNASKTRREFSIEQMRAAARHFRPKAQRPENCEGIVISVVNFKGGVAKTTTAFTLAQGLALRGHKVLMIDVDPQGSATSLFGVPPNTVQQEHTLLPLCIGTESSVDYAIQLTYWEGLDLIPSSGQLYGADFALPARATRAIQGHSDQSFWNVVDNGLDLARQNYDVIILDTSPALSYLTLNAMVASDGLIMPLPPSALDFASSIEFWDLFTELTDSFKKYGKYDKEFDFLGVLLSKVDTADKASTQAVRQWIAAAYGAHVWPIEIPKTSAAGSASAFAFGSVYDMRPNTKTLARAHEAYDSLVKLAETHVMTAWARQQREIAKLSNGGAA